MWKKIALAIHKTHYRIMDQDPIMHTYFIVGPVHGARIKRGAPIYQLTVSDNEGGVTLHLLDAKNKRLPSDKANQIYQAISKHYT